MAKAQGGGRRTRRSRARGLDARAARPAGEEARTPERTARARRPVGAVGPHPSPARDAIDEGEGGEWLFV